MQKKIIITGGPGTGKSTIINELLALEYTCIQEVSREVTLEARAKGIDQFFLSDPLLFSNLLLEKRTTQYKQAHSLKKNLVFFDRGIPDIQAYLSFSKTPNSLAFTEINNIYSYQKIFITPPWKEIYTTDNERYETFEEAVLIHEQILKTYSGLRYTPIEIPFGTPTERTNFIIKNTTL